MLARHRMQKLRPRRHWRRNDPNGWVRAMMRKRKAAESRRMESLLSLEDRPVDPLDLEDAFADMKAKWQSASGTRLTT
jgi:hypothetical protein